MKQGQRISNSSHAPSSYHRKRARLSSASPFATPSHSRPPSIQEQSRSSSKHLAWLSGTSSRGAPPCTPSRAASTHSQPADHHLPYTHKKSHDRRQSMSQISIPISALVSPHAPSIATSTKFHMRDPRKPPKKLKETEWGLHFATEDEPGSPLQAWLFFIGFILFPLWWIAALCIPVPKTRTAGDASLEKAVTIIDDPQIEHGGYLFIVAVMRVLITPSRREVLAFSMPLDGSCLAIHIYTFHRSGCHLRAKIAHRWVECPHFLRIPSALFPMNTGQRSLPPIPQSNQSPLNRHSFHNIDTRFSLTYCS